MIVNPSAGAAHAGRVQRVKEALLAVGVLPHFREVDASDVGPAALEASREGGLVAVAGGDGTLSAASAALAGTASILAPIPMGTRNHFARRLGIVNIEAAAQAVARGRVHRAPVGRLAGRIFIHHASAGIYPAMVHRRERLPPWLGRYASTVLASVHVLARLPLDRVRLIADGEERDLLFTGVWIGLGSESFRWPVDSRPPRGDRFEVVVSPARTRVGLLASAARAYRLLRRGESLTGAGLEVIKAESVVLEAARPIELSLDGEVTRSGTPLEFTFEPESLRVLTLAPDEGQDPRGFPVPL